MFMAVCSISSSSIDVAGVAGERAAGGDGQRRRPGDAGAGRRLAAGDEGRVGQAVVAREQDKEGQVAARIEVLPAARLDLLVGVDGLQGDATVGAARWPRGRAG